MDPIHIYRGVHVSQALAGRMTALDGLAEQLDRNPEAPFMTEVATSGDRLTLTYGEFDEYSRRAMTWMRHELGLHAGDVLGLTPRNNLRSVVALFGAMRLGAAVAFLNPQAPPRRHAAICGALKARAVLTTPPKLQTLPPSADRDAVLDPAADAFYFATSGSTASSKIVAQTHRGAAANALAMRRHHGIGPGCRFLGCLPIHHVNGFHFTVLATVFCGSHAMLLHGFDPFRYPILLQDFRPRLASVVPSVLQALLATWRDPHIPEGFEYFVSAAAPLSRQTAREVWERWGVKVLQGYGLTETINFSTTLPRSLSDAAYQRQVLDAEIPSIGVAVDGNEVAVLNPSGRRLGPGEAGEICVRGHNVMESYAGNLEATAEAFKHRWFHTGDIGFERVDSEAGPGFFAITGRTKNIAKIQGQSVSLEEMERVLVELHGIEDAACIALTDRMLGETIVAVLVADASVKDQHVLVHLRQVFAEGALPRRIVRSQTIPRTSTGKILRPTLHTYLKTLL